MEVQVGGAAIRADVAHYRENARKLGWPWIRRGDWFNAWMRPLLLEGAPPGEAEPLESADRRIRIAQARIGSAASGELEAQDTETIEDALSGSRDEVPDALYRAAGRAIFVAREHTLLARDCRTLEGQTPTQWDVPAIWEILAAVIGVSIEDFEDEAEEAGVEPLAASPSAPFGLQKPSLEVGRKLGARMVRNAVWQTAVPHVGRAAWAGWNELNARQIAALCLAYVKGGGDFVPAMNRAHVEFENASRLIILGMWSMAVADANLHHREIDAISRLCVALDIPGDMMGSLRKRSDMVADEFLNELDRVAMPEAKRLVHDAVMAAALADGRLEPSEMDYLRRISERLGEPFDEEAIRTRLALLHGPQG